MEERLFANDKEISGNVKVVSRRFLIQRFIYELDRDCEMSSVQHGVREITAQL